MHATLDATEAGILSRVIQPEAGGWSPAAADAILGFSFSEADKERMIGLLNKSKGQDLEEAEKLELASFHHVGRLLELMKSRARLSLKQAAA